MNGALPTAQTMHASTVAINGRAVLLTGPSGAGKSDLALQLLERAFMLVSDDQTIVSRDGDRLIASAPPAIAGKLEIRGIGIVDLETVGDVPVALLVELTSDVQRLPDEKRELPVLGIRLPLVSVDARAASAASKIALALDRLGLRFS
jgi:serine kinase of HPr protein (carbohydrate metabolism regulator)